MPPNMMLQTEERRRGRRHRHSGSEPKLSPGENKPSERERDANTSQRRLHGGGMTPTDIIAAGTNEDGQDFHPHGPTPTSLPTRMGNTAHVGSLRRHRITSSLKPRRHARPAPLPKRLAPPRRANTAAASTTTVPNSHCAPASPRLPATTDQAP